MFIINDFRQGPPWSAIKLAIMEDALLPKKGATSSLQPYSTSSQESWSYIFSSMMQYHCVMMLPPPLQMTANVIEMSTHTMTSILTFFLN